MNKNEAIQVIRNNFPTGRHQLCKALETLIPELKKSDDEKIRKTLKSFFDSEISDYGNVEWRNGIRYGEIVSWLEKQCEQKHLFYPIKDYQGSFPCWNNAHYIRPKHLQRCICYDKYMKGVYCYVYDDISKYWCNQMTEEHDSNGDNHVCDYTDYRITRWMPIPYTSLNVHSKVEPKFKVGDWIVDDRGNIARIAEIKNDSYGTLRYYFEWVNGNKSDLMPCFVDNKFHLWTIQDAKEGDVIFSNDGHGSDSIELIKSVYDKCINFWFCLSSKNNFKDYYYEVYNGNIPYTNFASRKDATPATKEQRDLLFSKMKEAGYEWSDKDRKLIKMK